MFITPSMKYRDLRRGSQYRLLDEGEDYKVLSVKGSPLYVPDYIFEQGYMEEESGNEEIETEVA
jgi:hypothetical protein